MLISRLRPGRFTWPALYVGVFVVAAAMHVVAGRHQWYFFDEWRLIVERVVAPGDVTPFERLFRPDGEHVIAVPLALFIVLAKIGGLTTYWPFVVANLCVRLVTLWVADDIARRFGARRAARLLVLASIAFFGEGYESLFGQSLIFSGLTLLFSLFAIREAIRLDVATPRSSAVATLLLTLAVFSTSYAFPVVVGVALFFALTRRWVASIVALVVPPVAFLTVRMLAGGSYSEQQEISPTYAGLYIDYIQTGLGVLGEGVTGLVGLGLAAFVAVVVASVLAARDRRTLYFVGTVTFVIVAFFGQASLSRSALGADQAGSSRYVFFCGVLVFVMLGAAWAARRVEPRLAVVVALLFAVSFSNSIGRLRDGYDFFIPKMELSRQRLGVGFVASEAAAEFIPDPDWAPDLRYERLAAVAAWPGSDGLLSEGRQCFEALSAELRRAGTDPFALDPRDRAVLVVLLNEHGIGYGPPEATLGELLRFASAGETGSRVLDQFVAEYADLSNVFGDNPTVPRPVRCR